jgi:DNA-binding response OmpR family regulator
MTKLLLLVEDEPTVRELLEVTLADAGFEVVSAHDGRQALAELELDTTRFTAIITDIQLGAGPSGWEVGRRGRELVPNMPIIYMSGDKAHEWISRGVPNSTMIAKPFAIAQMITMVSVLITESDTHRLS